MDGWSKRSFRLFHQGRCGGLLSLTLNHDDFQGFGGGMRRQFDGGGGLREGQLVSN